jgi:superfamily II DNA or RNA helicase
MTNVWENLDRVSYGVDSLDLSAKKTNGSNKHTNKSSKSKKDNRVDCNGMELIICQKGVKASIHRLQDLNLYRKLINYFSISVPQMGGYIKKVVNHRTLVKTSQLLLPRFGMLDYMDKNLKNYTTVNHIRSGSRPSIPFNWEGSFTNNQPIIADHIMNNQFNEENSNTARAGVILNLEAGQGKSYLATGLMEKIQRKTLIVCHTISILNQWVKLLKVAYPNNVIGRYFGKVKEKGDICVAIINSLLMDKLYDETGEITASTFFQPFGYVIFDEIHLYSSNSRKQIYNRCQRKYMLGLSATPDENKDGLDAVNTWHCGGILKADELEGYTMEDIPFIGEVSVVKFHGHPDYIKILMNEKMDIINHSGMVNQICEDPYRLHMIVKLVFELRSSGKNIFVFADRRAYLKKIQLYMNIFGIASHNLLKDSDQKNVMSLMGGSSAEDMDNAKDNANVILTTYAFMGTGVSIPRMDSIVLATPRKSKSRQYINRIFRLGGDYTSMRKIVDVVDWSTHMKTQWYHRKKYYDEKNYTISAKTIKWCDMNDEMIEMKLKDDDVDTIKEPDELETSLQELEYLISRRPINI